MSLPRVKCLIQQCCSARLQVKPADEAAGLEAEYVTIERRGVVLFVCFMRDADESDVDKLGKSQHFDQQITKQDDSLFVFISFKAKSVLNIKLSEKDGGGGYVSALDLPASVLIIPQASLGGRMRGKLVQYHHNIEKERGRELYERFVDQCRQLTSASQSWSSPEHKCRLHHGTYGNRQVYSTETNGPFLHIIEF